MRFESRVLDLLLLVFHPAPFDSRNIPKSVVRSVNSTRALEWKAETLSNPNWNETRKTKSISCETETHTHTYPGAETVSCTENILALLHRPNKGMRWNPELIGVRRWLLQF